MKNITPYSSCDISYHNKITDSLNKGKSKDNVVSNKDIIEASFADYKLKFQNKSLFNISAYGFIGEDKSSLLKLYSSSRKLTRPNGS